MRHINPIIARCMLLLVVLAAVAPASFAQQAQVRTSGDPYYVDVPITIQVSLEGFEQSPPPTIEVEPPPGAKLDLTGVSPNVSTSIQIINGRMTRTELVQFTYRYRLVVTKPGRVTVGPFRASQGVTTVTARAVQFDVQALPTSDTQRFQLILPDGPVWVGQRVPVKLEWWLSESLAERLAGRSATVPLFEQLDRFRFEDDESVQAKSTIAITSSSGTLELPAEVRREQWRNEPYLVVTVQRTMVALKSGTLDIEPATMVVEEAIRWRRDFFGSRVPTNVRRIKVTDERRTLEVKAPPSDGRPPSFAGAVGQGFNLDVSADRSVVQAGDPIRLTLTVRGDGALDTVSLPRLDASGLSADDFTIPSEAIAGSVEGDEKQFELNLRANHVGVREIPPISFSWFDPASGSYETTQSRPIAVSVKASTIVSASDVVRSAPASPDQTSADISGATQDSGATPTNPAATAARFDDAGNAELAINTDLTALLSEPKAWYTTRAAVVGLHSIGVVLLMVAWAVRRRTQKPPEERELQRALANDARTLKAAGSAAELAGILRRMAARAPAVPREDLDRILNDLDNLAFAPTANPDTTVEPSLRERALTVAQVIMESAK